MRDKLFEQGLKIRKQVLGAEYVERQIKNADELTMPAGSTPEEFAAYIKSESVKWAKIVKESGAKAE